MDEGDDRRGFLERQAFYFDASQQKLVAEQKFVILGLGANGGPCALMLARLGAERITIADHDVVETSNLNRQPYDVADVGAKKAEALAKRLKAINPHIEVESEPAGYQESNALNLVRDAGAIVDAMDNYRMKVHLSRWAQDQGAHVVHTSGAGSRGAVTTFPPQGPAYEELFSLPSLDRELGDVADSEFDAYRHRVAEIIGPGMYDSEQIERMRDGDVPWPTIAPNCWISGSIAAIEATKVMLGLTDLLVLAPEILQFDVRLCHFTRFRIEAGAASTSYPDDATPRKRDGNAPDQT